MEHYLNCKKIETAINRARTQLIKRASKHGIYENFGDEEQRKIRDYFLDISDYSKEGLRKRELLQNFTLWCMNYTK